MEEGLDKIIEEGKELDITENTGKVLLQTLDSAETTAKEVRGLPFKKGHDPRRNTEGRTKGSLSVIGKLKQIWKDNPEDFEGFVKQYMEDPNNRKHITEMIDGKAWQNIGIDGGAEGLAIQFASDFNKDKE